MRATDTNAHHLYGGSTGHRGIDCIPTSSFTIHHKFRQRVTNGCECLFKLRYSNLKVMDTFSEFPAYMIRFHALHTLVTLLIICCWITPWLTDSNARSPTTRLCCTHCTIVVRPDIMLLIENDCILCLVILVA